MTSPGIFRAGALYVDEEEEAPLNLFPGHGAGGSAVAVKDHCLLVAPLLRLPFLPSSSAGVGSEGAPPAVGPLYLGRSTEPEPLRFLLS